MASDPNRQPIRTPRRAIDGVLLLDKGVGLSSNAALQRARRLYRAEKAGHTGTLDPLASGLLPICFGEATKFAHMLLEGDKTYAATVRLGVTTTTGDAEGDPVAEQPVLVSRGDIEGALARFIGPIAQIPPRHAALKYRGRNYYEYAREGIDIPRAAREVVVHELSLDGWNPPDAKLSVRCGKGTYVRVLAEDLGAALGCGGHLAALRRVASGGFDVADALSLEGLEALDDAARDARLLPVDALLSTLPRLELDASDAWRLARGQAIAGRELPDGDYRAYAADRFVGVARANTGVVRPRRQLATGDAGDAPLEAVESLES
ncbi:MAG TPA: tRNA pseudouridine(55) synthase TruB [Casimicrobiaceae bacterium]|nr:tRNA pseudouridine(55) synthase TruB [Casimicrobiaceae bacterium]